MDPCDSGNPDNSVPYGGGQRTNFPPKDPQNEQRDSTTCSTQNSIDGISVVHNPKVESGERKLPIDSPVNPSCGNSPATNAASGRLVYVRRRADVDTAKGSAENGTVSPARNQPKEPTLALVSSSTKSSGAESPPQGPSSHRLDWEERYHHLHMLLNKLNDSDRTDHVQMLWSLSSAELSKHAVELEKRSIQFSLEEAREMQRVAALNVLEKSLNRVKSTSNDRE